MYENQPFLVYACTRVPTAPGPGSAPDRPTQERISEQVRNAPIVPTPQPLLKPQAEANGRAAIVDDNLTRTVAVRARYLRAIPDSAPIAGPCTNSQGDCDSDA